MSETKELVLLQNQTSKPTCLIYRIDEAADGLSAEMELWSDQVVEVGSEIKSNSGAYLFPTPGSIQRAFIRSLEVSEIKSVRDTKGQWDTDRERKNKQTYYTLQVVPFVEED